MGAASRLPDDLRAFAQRLRRESTDAEALLWKLLRGKQLGFKFRRQHPIGRFILDFYCAETRLAIELDGGQRAEGPQAARDVCRDEVLRRAGVRVLRLFDDELLMNPDAVVEAIWNALHFEGRDGV
jgi:very-short-patch-repair endonuclease